MKILVITQYFWPENFRINDLVEDLMERGHQVTILTGQPNYPSGAFYKGYGWRGTREESYNGARVIRVALMARGKQGNAIKLALNYLSYALFATLAVVLRLNKNERFDVIFVFEISPATVGIPAIAARKKFKAPMLFWVLDLWPESLRAVGAVNNPLLLRIVERMVHWIYRRCDLILVASQAFIPEILRCGGVEKKIRYFPNWGESVFDAPEQKQVLVEVPLSKGFTILYGGNIGEAQDFPIVLEAMECLKRRPDIQLVLIGSGRMDSWIKEEIMRRNLEKSVRLIPQQPLARMPGYFAAADILFLSLKADPIFAKTIPGKLQSYLAAGKPILASLDGEGAKVLQESGAGLVCPAGNAVKLAQAMETYAAMEPRLRVEMGMKARLYYEAHFARTHVLSQLEGWMHELVETI